MALAGSNRKPALTAAAAKIGYSKQSADKIREAPWQERAWQVYEMEGSIYFMTRYRAAVSRKIDYFVATVDSPGDDPDRDATYNDEGELVALGPGAKVLEAEGGPELLRRIVSEMMVHWDVPGEAYLTRFDEEPLWRVLSTQEIRKSGNSYSWGDEKNQMGNIDPDGVYRVWKAHPRYHWEPDSPTKHILEDAEELILLRRELKARSNSRLPAGVLLLPDTLDLSPFAEDEEGTEDDIARWLTETLAEAVRDPGSTRSLAPTVMTMHGDDIEKVRWLTFERVWDTNMEQRQALLRSIATGLDVPPEILTGMADLNHWSAWLVSEQAVSQHVAPTVDDILDSLTVSWFKPLLEASGINPDAYVLWRDLSPATVAPDVSDLSLRLFEAGVISDVTVRRDTNHDEGDAPQAEEGQVAAMDADELLKRINAFGTLRRAGAEWEDAVRAVGLPPIEQIPGLLPITVRAEEVVKNEEAVVSSIDDLMGGGSPLPGAAVTAAGRRRIVATELADLDAELLAWVQEQADLEIARLIDLALTSAVDPLDESNLASLASKLDKKIAQAQAAARAWLSRLLGRSPSDVGEDLARAQGVQTIIGGILEAARRKLFTPHASPDPIDTGVIGNLTTPTQAIRHGLSLAGGGPAVYEDGKAAELIGNGQKVHDELAEDGFFQDGYVWKYGHPANTFEPHLWLDGKQFRTWDDPQLAVRFGDSWLRRSFYAPGDHKGCCCAFIQVIVAPLADPGQPGPIQPTIGGSGNVATDGMSPEEAADYIAVKNDLTARYPKAAARVRHWGTGEDPISQAALRERFEESIMRGGDASRYREAIAILDTGDFHRAYIKAYDDPINGVFLDGPKGGKGSVIIVRPGIGLGKAPYKVDVPPDWTAIRYTATHEFGHAIEHDLLHSLADRTPLASSVSISPGYNAFQDAVVRTGYNGRKVSGYGAHNVAEGFAESFTASEAGVGGESVAKLLAMAEDAESWPGFDDVRDTAIMRPIEWIKALDELGDSPGYGLFEP